MISNLKFHLEFEHSDKILKDSHTFEKGLTAISGPNESGKSVRLEMIRYALFGSKALRTVASAYKKINCEMSFSVGAESFKVIREGSKHHLYRDDKDLASGVTAVNNAIKNILGYDLEVFDTANACLQNQIEDLTNKTPAERKRMVDRTIGLDAINTVAKKLADEVSTQKKIKESLEDQIYNVEKPTEPNIKKTKQQIQAELLSLRDQEKELIRVKSLLNAKKVLAPVEPDLLPTSTLSIQELEEKVKQLTVDISKADQIPHLKATLYTGSEKIEEVNEYVDNDGEKRWKEYKEYKAKKVEDPTPHSLRDIVTALEVSLLEREYELLEQSLEDTVTCPKCLHEFPVQGNPDEKWSSGDFEFDDYAEILRKYKVMFSEHWSDLRSLYQKKQSFEEFQKLPVIEKPEFKDYGSMTRAVELKKMINNGLSAQRQLDQLDEDALLQKKIDLKETLMFIKNMELNKRNQETYEEKKKQYKDYLELARKHSKFLDDTKNVEQDIKELESLLSDVEIYERQIHNYNELCERNNKVQESINEAETQIEELNLARKALNNLKPKVKLYLMPSLNRVASNLISQMTNGARNTVVVDENFEVMVDGQPVDTLSGSGKAVANLALRIGLGTVLTNKVFSVLLADEIDSAMDADRAAYTAKCLRNLTKTINQIILVSHQQPEADQHIQL